MPTAKLNLDAVKHLKFEPNPDHPLRTSVIYWDQTCPGFGVRVSSKGRKTWIAFYRVKGGKAVMETIGTTATIPDAKNAREMARNSMIKAGQGINAVAQQRTQERERKAAAAAEAAAAVPFSAVAERFIKEYVEKNTKPATARERGRALNRAAARWEGRAAKSITKADVIKLINEVGATRMRKLNRAGASAGALNSANAMLKALKQMFKWCVQVDLIDKDADPTAGVLKPTKENSRDRVLLPTAELLPTEELIEDDGDEGAKDDDGEDGAEIIAFWKGCDQLGWPFGPLFKLLLLTAQRRSEVAGMRWSELRLSRGLWVIPKERTKNDKAHVVHLSCLALEIIKALPRFESSDLVFSTTGTAPVSGFSKAKARLDALMKPMLTKPMEEWRLHDLRRTATTGMAKLNIAPHVADKVLNHQAGTIRGVAAVYNRFAYLDERKAALEAWGRYLETLVHPDRVPGNVTPLRQRESVLA